MNIDESLNSEKIENTSNTDILTGNTNNLSYEDSSEKLNEFVAKNIEVMRSYLISNSNPSISQLNKALVDYMPVLYSLQTLYNKVKFNKLKVDEELDIFEAEAYMNVRNEYNNKDIDKKLFLSTKEIEAAYKVKYKNKLTSLRAKVDLAESRRSFVERLLKAWENYQFILSNLSKNLVAELSANHLDIQGQRLTPNEEL